MPYVAREKNGAIIAVFKEENEWRARTPEPLEQRIAFIRRPKKRGGEDPRQTPYARTSGAATDRT